ncbi:MULTISPECIES: hypothetical protein [Pseudoalteromonas]|uniref:Uncharacterized protein n=1 Tax=Pseudoalteromonas amylolytica TaxID=1859457 RepID=A0A1S1MXX4_9GAMM|nr:MULTISPECIES: hypothetical protein [Pseudoalteromonas]OHU89330.1 hypothetical protein BFC16_06785 [Pseudoalteromonas sp. JW3]OHU92230.1 hypothetical protein BET10_07890 [Pseudoalteromonas amylolytica]
MQQVSKFILLGFVVLVLSQSHHHPQLLDSQTRNHYLAAYPQSYFFTQHRVKLEALPDLAIQSMLVLGEPDVLFEWSIRLAKRMRYHASSLYWKKHYADVSKAQQQRLQQVFTRRKAFEELNRLSEVMELTEQASTLLASERGVLPQQLSRSAMAEYGLAALVSRWQFAPACLNRVLMLSDHYSGVIKLDEIRAQYLQQPEPMPDSYCLSEVFYVGDLMSCAELSSGFAQCDIAQLLANYRKQLDNVDYLVVMTRAGKANVFKGVMTLTTAHDYQVFLHELMHFSGFEDEYAIAPSKAQWLCKQSGQLAPNLIVTNGKPPENWHVSETCQNGSAFQAYKPSERWSIMQYQELPLSDSYRTLWQNAVNSKRYRLETLSSW